MDVWIDQFTQCLVDVKTGMLVDTAFGRVSKQELKRLKGWAFDWTAPDLKTAEIYKLLPCPAQILPGEKIEPLDITIRELHRFILAE